MKSMQVGATIRFVLAMSFYLVAWIPGAYGLALFSIVWSCLPHNGQ